MLANIITITITTVGAAGHNITTMTDNMSTDPCTPSTMEGPTPKMTRPPSMPSPTPN